MEQVLWSIENVCYRLIKIKVWLISVLLCSTLIESNSQVVQSLRVLFESERVKLSDSKISSVQTTKEVFLTLSPQKNESSQKYLNRPYKKLLKSKSQRERLLKR